MPTTTESGSGAVTSPACGAEIPDTDDVQVLYIAGIGRSGSTMLCRTLGSVGGFVGTGELMRVLGRGLLNGDLCSCGTPVKRCSIWTDVGRELERRCPGLNLHALEQTRKRVTESWEFLRYLFLPNTRSALGRDLDAYRRFLAALYRSVRAVTGARIVVDASKNIMFARLLTETPGIRMSVLHLVRDSRGVAYSLVRRQERPGTHDRREYFRQINPLLSSLLWTSANLMAERTGRRTASYHRVRYEDFVSDPAATVRGIVRAVGGAAPADLSHVNGGSIYLGIDHLIASNPNRSRRGDIELREDTAWRREMSATGRWVVSGVTFPLLRRYGYDALPGGMALRPSASQVLTGPPEPEP